MNSKIRIQKLLFKAVFGILFLAFCLTLYSPTISFSYEEDLWPLWPLATYIPEPPKMNLLYYDSENNPIYEVVVDGLSTEPISFFSIGRSAMAWVDRVPMIELGDPLPEEAWGSVIEVLNIDAANEIKVPDFSEDIPYLCKAKKNDGTSLVNLEGGYGEVENALIINSVLKEYASAWYDSDNDGTPDISNQTFPSDWITSWVGFLENNTKYDEYIGDSGHSSPLIVWPDNIWLAPFENWFTYMENTVSQDYAEYGGAIMFATGNDGFLRAFDTDPDDDGNLDGLWAFMPPSAFMFSIYHQNMRMYNQVNGDFLNPAFPRLVTLDGPIAIHDMEDSAGNWKRLLVGTMGQGTYVNYKPSETWNSETGEVGVVTDSPPSSLTDAHAWGVYAIDITEMDSPSLEWSVSNAYWGSDGVLWIDDDKYFYNNTSISDNYTEYKDVTMTPTRPIFGYTEDNGQRIWHLLLLGIDRQNYFHVYDIDPEDGSIRSDYQLSDQPWSLTAEKDGKVYPDDVFRPSRIAAALAWNERTPLLSNVYFFLSNGALYDWNLQDETAPRKLLHVYGQQGDTHSQPLQDFDITFLEESQDDDSIETHRFMAVVCGFPKNGNPSNVVETEHFALLTIDLTELIEDYDLPQTVETATFFGHTNEYLYPASYLQFVYLALRAVDEEEEDFGSNQGPHWNTAYPASSPVFYDGKVILVTRGYVTKGKKSNQDAWSRVYVLDPVAEELPHKFDTQGVTHLGGALIDENAILYSPTTGGVLSQDLSGYVDPLGEQGGGSSVSTSISSRYWKVR